MTDAAGLDFLGVAKAPLILGGAGYALGYLLGFPKLGAAAGIALGAAFPSAVPRDTSGLLDHDATAQLTTGPGHFITLYYTAGRGYSWGRSFYALSVGSALGSMRPDAWAERQYLFRWLPNERRWGRVA